MNARRIVLPLIVMTTAVAIWWFSPTVRDDVPVATWRLGGESDFRQPGNYERTPAGTALRLSFHAGAARHVYVLSRSDEDGTLLMFPSPDVKSDQHNPLPAGRSVLPGQRDGASLAWKTRPDIPGTTCYVVVAAAQPIAELEQLLPRLRRWTNSALTSGTMETTQPQDGEVLGKARTPWPSALLQRAAERAKLETLVNGPLHDDELLPQVWSSAFYLTEERSDQPKALEPGKPIPGVPIPITPVPAPGGGK
ncbi:MAG: hypothetical protein H6835_02485 [Planctomycetes bacterium]|nr:hypothetical protein [Planctomycetota bacterium]